MKKYIKPNTEQHNIEVVVMQATSPVTTLNNYNATKNVDGDYDDAKTVSFSSSNAWDEEE